VLQEHMTILTLHRVYINKQQTMSRFN